MTPKVPAAGRRVDRLLARLAAVAGVLLVGCSGTDDQVLMLEVPCSISIDAVDDIGPSYAAQVLLSLPARCRVAEHNWSRRRFPLVEIHE